MIDIPIHITPRALDKIRRIIREKKIPSFYGLRTGIQGGGCGGVMTKLLGFDSKNDLDQEFNIEEIILYLDNRQTIVLAGTTIDYSADGEEEGFIFLDNPSS